MMNSMQLTLELGLGLRSKCPRMIENSQVADLGMSLDSKSANKELKVVTPEKNKSFVAAFTKKLVTTFQLSRTRGGHISLK